MTIRKGLKMYNRTEVKEAIEKVEKFNITTIKKKNHRDFMYYNFKGLLEGLMSINRFLFMPENFYELKRYKLNIDTGATKKELDDNVRRLKEVILKHLKSIEREYC